jgi:hypothetical protein
MATTAIVPGTGRTTSVILVALKGLRAMFKRKLILLSAIAVLYGCAQSKCPETLSRSTAAGPEIVLAQPPTSAVTSSVPNESEPINYRKIADLRARLEEVKAAKSEALAKTISELDAWVFSEADEAEARSLVSGALVKLSATIAIDIRENLQAARKASDSKQRTAAIRKAEAIVGLFPTPRDEQTQADLDGLVASIKSTTLFLQDSQRLRYNQWALTRIQESLQQFHKAKKIFSNDQDRLALIKICQDSLGPINPSHLEPAVLDLYHHSLGLTRASLKEKEDLMLTLAKGLTDPALVRRSPMDF